MTLSRNDRLKDNFTNAFGKMADHLIRMQPAVFGKDSDEVIENGAGGRLLGLFHETVERLTEEGINVDDPAFLDSTGIKKEDLYECLMLGLSEERVQLNQAIKNFSDLNDNAQETCSDCRNHLKTELKQCKKAEQYLNKHAIVSRRHTQSMTLNSTFSLFRIFKRRYIA